MINNNWQTLGVGLMDTQEIVRIVTSNTTRIDLPTWLRSEPYMSVAQLEEHYLTCVTVTSIVHCMAFQWMSVYASYY